MEKWWKVTAEQVIASAISGAISGAIGALAGPVGGSVAKYFGQVASGSLAKVAAGVFSAGGGGHGQVAANAIDPSNASSPITAGLWAGVGVQFKVLPTKKS